MLVYEEDGVTAIKEEGLIPEEETAAGREEDEVRKNVRRRRCVARGLMRRARVLFRVLGLYSFWYCIFILFDIKCSNNFILVYLPQTVFNLSSF